jgi:uncharacterized protein
MLYGRSINFLRGNRIAKDEIAAFTLNQEAARLGHHDATLAMGWFYLNGIGVAENWDEAWHWYRKSARQGDSRAMFSLGYMCYKKQYPAEAKAWFSRAAKAGHMRSVCWLGKLYWKGSGVEEDKKRGISLFQQAA